MRGDIGEHAFEKLREGGVIRGPFGEVGFEDVRGVVERCGGVPELDGGLRVLAAGEVDGRGILLLCVCRRVLDADGRNDSVHDGHEDLPLGLVEDVGGVGQPHGHGPRGSGCYDCVGHLELAWFC